MTEYCCHSGASHSDEPQMRNCASGNLEIPGSRFARPGMTVTTKIEPFRCQGAGWEVAYPAVFLISNESSCANAHSAFPTAAISTASCGARLRNPDGWRVAVRHRNAQIVRTCNLPESTK
jgi:hypothetical protein